MWTLEALTSQLRTSLHIWKELGDRRRKKDRLLGEYHRGLATGIFVTLGATGHKNLQERLARDVLREDGTDAAFLTGLIIGTGLRS